MRILTIDDHALFRRCMVDFLHDQQEVQEVAEAASFVQGLDVVSEVRPDITLVDIDLGGQDGLALAEQIIASCPETAVVMLTADQAEEQMLRAVQIGARGYLLKDIDPENLIQELRKVMQGEMVFPQAFLLRQVKSNLVRQLKREAGNEVELTAREQEVLQLVTDGLTDREVGGQLSVSENTVKNHMKSIRKKLGVSNRVQATMAGLKQGIVNKS